MWDILWDFKNRVIKYGISKSRQTWRVLAQHKGLCSMGSYSIDETGDYCT